MALYAALHPLLEEKGGDDEFMPKKVDSRDTLQTSPTQPTIPVPKSDTPHTPTAGALRHRELVPQPSDPAVPGVWGHLLTPVPRLAASESLGAGAGAKQPQAEMDLESHRAGALAEQRPVPTVSGLVELPPALPAPPAHAAAQLSAGRVLRGELSAAEQRAVAAAQLKLQRAQDRKARRAACTPPHKPGVGPRTPPSRGPWGSLGSFAGRRPPANPEKLQLFKELKQAYENIIMYRKVKSELKSGGTDRQKMYWSFMQAELTSAGASSTVSPKEMFAAAVAKWKNEHTEPVTVDTVEHGPVGKEEPPAEEEEARVAGAAEHPPGQGRKRKAPAVKHRLPKKMSVADEHQWAKKK